MLPMVARSRCRRSVLVRILITCLSAMMMEFCLVMCVFVYCCAFMDPSEGRREKCIFESKSAHHDEWYIFLVDTPARQSFGRTFLFYGFWIQVLVSGSGFRFWFQVLVADWRRGQCSLGLKLMTQRQFRQKYLAPPKGRGIRNSNLKTFENF